MVPLHSQTRPLMLAALGLVDGGQLSVDYVIGRASSQRLATRVLRGVSLSRSP